MKSAGSVRLVCDRTHIMTHCLAGVYAWSFNDMILRMPDLAECLADSVSTQVLPLRPQWHTQHEDRE